MKQIIGCIILLVSLVAAIIFLITLHLNPSANCGGLWLLPAFPFIYIGIVEILICGIVAMFGFAAGVCKLTEWLLS